MVENYVSAKIRSKNFCSAKIWSNFLVFFFAKICWKIVVGENLIETFCRRKFNRNFLSAKNLNEVFFSEKFGRNFFLQKIWSKSFSAKIWLQTICMHPLYGFHWNILNGYLTLRWNLYSLPSSNRVSNFTHLNFCSSEKRGVWGVQPPPSRHLVLKNYTWGFS